jgi:glucan biosynthesis protein C
MDQSSDNKNRLLYFDNLRALMVLLVLMVHTAVTYSGIGMWYYVENKTIDIGSGIFFGSFQSFNQAYFMSVLFMIAGYFIPESFKKKGPATFIKDRLFRLGVPLLVYIFILHSVTVKIAYPDLDITHYLINGIKTFNFVSRTGPLWFALTLLIFTLVYTATGVAFKKPMHLAPIKINAINIALLVIIITIPAFLIRLVMPIGTEFINLQLGYFSGYIVMFVIGIISKRLGLFERITYRAGEKWLAASLVLGYPCWLMIAVFGGPVQGEFLIFGGLSWQAFAYALWESFTCVTVSVGLIGIFRNRFNRQNNLQKLLSDNAFGAYVFHAPILVGISVSLKWLNLYPALKFIVVSVIAITATFIFTHVVRKIPLMRKIFS